MTELSVLIPANREMFLSRTVEDLLKNIEADTEVIAVLDSAWDDPKIVPNERVNVIYVPATVGQRAATNLAAKLARGKYLAKCDAHCSFDKGFDRKMLDGFKEHGDNVTAVPVMRNLVAFNWKCYHCGWKQYQGPTPSTCPDCNKSDKIRRKMIWEPRRGTYSQSYSFDAEPHFAYFQEFKHRDGYRNGVVVGYELSLTKPGLSASVVGLLTDFADSHPLARGTYHFWGGEDMAPDAMGLPPVDDSGGVGSSKILVVGDELEMEGVTTPSIATEVVNDGDVLTPSSGQRADKPRISNTMGKLFLSERSTPSITPTVNSSLPVPTTGSLIDSDVINKLNGILGGQFVYNEKTSSFHNGSVALRPVYDKRFTESMSLQGSFFMCTREKYWELNLSDESFGSWGNQGIELACKTWLSGGRVLVNHNTWYAHLFRTQGGDFSFPYDQSGRGVERTKKKVWEFFFNGKFKQQIHPVSWLVERFMPVPGWSDESLKKLKEKELMV